MGLTFLGADDQEPGFELSASALSMPWLTLPPTASTKAVNLLMAHSRGLCLPDILHDVVGLLLDLDEDSRHVLAHDARRNNPVDDEKECRRPPCC